MRYEKFSTSFFPRSAQAFCSGHPSNHLACRPCRLTELFIDSRLLTLPYRSLSISQQCSCTSQHLGRTMESIFVISSAYLTVNGLHRADLTTTKADVTSPSQLYPTYCNSTGRCSYLYTNSHPNEGHMSRFRAG